MGKIAFRASEKQRAVETPRVMRTTESSQVGIEEYLSRVAVVDLGELIQ